MDKVLKKIPEGWNVSSLKELSTVITKGTTPTTNGAGYTQSGIKFIRVENISSSGFITERDLKFISAETHEALKRSQLQAGDLLVSIAGAIGRSAIVAKGNLPANTNQAVGIVRLSVNEVVPGYVRYSIESPSVGQQISDSQAGNAQVNLNLEQLGQLRIYRPPLPEQQKIAAILSSVDDVIEKTRAQIDKLKDLKTGMMQELLAKGIGPTEFKDSPVGRIPVGWEVSELDDYLAYISYGFTNPMPESDEGPFMITAKDINGLAVQYGSARKTSEAAFNNLLTKKSRPHINDVLLTKDGTLGRVALVDRHGICINQSVAVLRPNERILPRFLLYLLAAPQYQREMLDKAGGSTIKHIYITVVDKMKVAVPERNEQEKIVNTLDAICSRINGCENKFVQYCSLKKSLVQDLLTGKVRVKLNNNEPTAASTQAANAIEKQQYDYAE